MVLLVGEINNKNRDQRKLRNTQYSNRYFVYFWCSFMFYVLNVYLVRTYGGIGRIRLDFHHSSLVVNKTLELEIQDVNYCNCWQ